MNRVIIEVTGDSSAAVDDATSSMLTDLANAGVKITPAQGSGERDGGAIALAIAILGGAASFAQLASTILTMVRKKEVQVILVDPSRGRLQIATSENMESLQKLIEQASTDA